MKNLKRNVLALALSAGVICAFAFSPRTTSNFSDPTYTWQHFLTDGITRDPANDINSGVPVSSAESTYGCNETVKTKCAVGTKVSGTGQMTVIIYYP